MTYRVLIKPSVLVSREYVTSTLIKLFGLSPSYCMLKVAGVSKHVPLLPAPPTWLELTEALVEFRHGLGIHSAVDLRLPGFLSSCHGTSRSDLVASLSPSGITGDNLLLPEATN